MISCTGPIVRINPHELVISDPEFYSTLYVAASTRKTNAYAHFMAGMNLGGERLITHNIDFLELTFSRSSHHDRSA